MKNINLFYEDREFSVMRRQKAELGLTWKEVIALGLKVSKGGKDGKDTNTKH